MAKDYLLVDNRRLPNGASVGIRGYENLPTDASHPDVSIVVFVTGTKGAYIDPDAFDGPPRGDEKKVIPSRELPEFIRRAGGISRELAERF